MQTLHGYIVDETKWESKGANGECNVATKDGKKFFIKRFNAPKYPMSDHFSGSFKEEQIRKCDTWLRRRNDIMRLIPGNGTGTLVKPIAYFRDGPCFYEVAHMVDITNIPYEEIWRKSTLDKTRIMLTVAMSLADLHQKGIVHGDLDPGNILISTAAGGNLITKLIDFSDSFLVDDPPEIIMSKDFWWSPEVAMYTKNAKENPNPIREKITCKIDVFSLGIVFHQYCSKNGRGPICTQPQPWQEFMIGKKPQVDPEIESEFFKELITSMLALEPDDRPSMAEVHKKLKDYKIQLEHGRRPIPNPPPIERERNIHPPIPEPVPVPVNPVNPEYLPGNYINRNGSRIVSVELINARKVRVFFSDRTNQVMDLSRALAQGYVEKSKL